MLGLQDGAARKVVQNKKWRNVLQNEVADSKSAQRIRHFKGRSELSQRGDQLARNVHLHDKKTKGQAKTVQK